MCVRESERELVWDRFVSLRFEANNLIFSKSMFVHTSFLHNSCTYLVENVFNNRLVLSLNLQW